MRYLVPQVFVDFTTEHERKCVYVWESVYENECATQYRRCSPISVLNMCMCVRERKSVCVRERECCVCVREATESACERERATRYPRFSFISVLRTCMCMRGIVCV